MALGGLSVSDDVIGLVAPIVVYWLYAAFYHALDALQLARLEKVRLHPREDVEKKNMVGFGQVVKGVLFQQLLQLLVGTFLLFVDPTSQGQRPIPPLWVCATQFLVAMFIMDTWQYFWHRAMHQNKYLYRNLHSWHHRLLVPYACGALYNHPLEGLLMDTVGGALSYLLTGMHVKVATFFWCFATMKTIDDHCGLMLISNPFQVLFNNNASYHDVHHQMSGLKYNFSQPFFTVWDRVLGTYMPHAIQKRAEGGLEVKPMLPNKASAKVASTSDEKLVNGEVHSSESLVNRNGMGWEKAMAAGCSTKDD